VFQAGDQAFWQFGAVCAARGVCAGLVTGCINAEAMSRLLDKTSFHVVAGALQWLCSTLQVGTEPEDDCGSPTTSP